MAIIDTTLAFSDGQAITADAGSTNIVDLGATGTPHGSATALVRDIGKGKPIEIEVIVTEAFNNLTTMNVKVQTDGDVAFGSPVTVAQSGEIALAALVVGYRFPFPATLMEGVNERYVRLHYDITGAAPAAGKVSAHVVASRQTNG